ncbi:MAG: hypothetical protein ACLFQT_11225 [Thiohalophilus sp.]
MTMSSETNDRTPVLTLVNNDPPGPRCNRNIQAAAEVANRYRITVQLLPRSLAAPGAVAPAVYLDGTPLVEDGDAYKGVADVGLLEEALDQAGVPRQAKPGRLTEISAELEKFREAIGPVPGQ